MDDAGVRAWVRVRVQQCVVVLLVGVGALAGAGTA